MIQFSLICEHGHRFDSWFQSGAAFEKLQAAGHVACAICGAPKVEKALMAPRLSTQDSSQDSAQNADAPQQDAPPAPLSAPQSPAEQAIAAMKAHVEANSDYVGSDFAREARAMHLGDSPERAIWGEARTEEAKALIEDGIPVAPLPFTPTRKSN
ncbi:MAG: DUF1178 family protein [Pelagimonas sp.]|jgi:hypothetical protein|nr:DUF1178 family protein [Pelagimonas sp.]